MNIFLKELFVFTVELKTYDVALKEMPALYPDTSDFEAAHT